MPASPARSLASQTSPALVAYAEHVRASSERGSSCGSVASSAASTSGGCSSGSSGGGGAFFALSQQELPAVMDSLQAQLSIMGQTMDAVRATMEALFVENAELRTVANEQQL